MVVAGHIVWAERTPGFVVAIVDGAGVLVVGPLRHAHPRSRYVRGVRNRQHLALAGHRVHLGARHEQCPQLTGALESARGQGASRVAGPNDRPGAVSCGRVSAERDELRELVERLHDEQVPAALARRAAT